MYMCMSIVFAHLSHCPPADTAGTILVYQFLPWFDQLAPSAAMLATLWSQDFQTKTYRYTMEVTRDQT